MPRRTALILLAVIVCAVGVNTLVALAARGSESFSPLQFPVYAAFTVAGVIAGWFGWQAVRRRSERAREVLKVLVPVVTLVSFVPDVALMTLKFIPGATAGGVAGLMVMHLVVVAFAVPGYLLAAPVPARAAVPA